LIYVIEADPEFDQFIVDTAEEKWRRYFERRERPPIGGNKISTEWLKRAYPLHKQPDMRPATDAEIALLTRYGQVRAQRKVLTKEIDELENKLRDAVKDREGLEWPHGSFVWRKTKDGTEIDWHAMAIALRTYYIKDPDPRKQEEARQKVTDEHTRPKLGHRYIRFTWDGAIEDEEAADAA
jgi:hypothetical protein